MTSSNTQERRLAVVAGASGAIGAAVAHQLAAADWGVIGTFHLHQPAPHPGIRWVPFDGADEDSLDELRAALDSDVRPMQAVISCIGAPSSKRRIADTDADEFDAVFMVNVMAVVRLWQIVCKHARLGAVRVVLLGSDTTATLRPGNGPAVRPRPGWKRWP